MRPLFSAMRSLVSTDVCGLGHKYQTRLASLQKYHLHLGQLSLKYIVPKTWFVILKIYS